jgi:hypothetical protein
MILNLQNFILIHLKFGFDCGMQTELATKIQPVSHQVSQPFLIDGFGC